MSRADRKVTMEVEGDQEGSIVTVGVKCDHENNFLSLFWLKLYGMQNVP